MPRRVAFWQPRQVEGVEGCPVFPQGEWDYSSSHRAIDAGAQGECIPPRRLGSNLDADEIMEYGWVFERRSPPRTSNGNYLVRSPN